MGQNLISIVVPVYGVEAYLPKCIDSILNQTCTDMEIILVDDGSPDRCPAICDEYARKDSRIRVIHKPNGGVMSARKAGALAASGAYILSIDSDDYITENLVKEINAVISAHHPDAVVFGFEKFEQECQKIYASAIPDADCFLDKAGVDRLRKSYMFDIAVKGLNGGSLLYSMCTKAIRRDLYLLCQDTVPDTITNGEDTLFTMKLLTQCSSLYISSIRGYMYRCRPGSTVNSIAENDFTMLGQLLGELRKVQGSYTDMDNQISAYMTTRINALINNAVRTGMTYNEFRHYIEGSLPILQAEPVRYGVQLKRGSYKDSFLAYLIHHKMWKILFLYKKAMCHS